MMDRRKVIFWAPRVLVISYILFISLFAFDVFTEGTGVFEIIVALFMHLIPSFVLIAILYFSWKNPKVGAIVFLLIAIIFTLFFGTYEDIIVFLMLTVPLLVMSGLFYLDHKHTG